MFSLRRRASSPDSLPVPTPRSTAGAPDRPAAERPEAPTDSRATIGRATSSIAPPRARGPLADPESAASATPQPPTGSAPARPAPPTAAVAAPAEPAPTTVAAAPTEKAEAPEAPDLEADEAWDENPVPLNPTAPAFPTWLLLVRAAHLRQAVFTALALGVAAAVTGRPGREVLLVVLTVLVGQVVIGWHNDLVDAERDHRHDTPGKPVAQGLLEVSGLWYAIAVGALVLVPLAVTNGVNAGISYLLSVAIALLGNVALRQTPLSWVPWALAWALYVPFVSQGGWGGQATGTAPEPALMVIAGGIGICVHVLTSLPGLLADHKDGSRSLPLRLALWWGAPRLLWIASGTLVALVIGLLLVARQLTIGE